MKSGIWAADYGFSSQHSHCLTNKHSFLVTFVQEFKIYPEILYENIPVKYDKNIHGIVSFSMVSCFNFNIGKQLDWYRLKSMVWNAYVMYSMVENCAVVILYFI